MKLMIKATLALAAALACVPPACAPPAFADDENIVNAVCGPLASLGVLPPDLKKVSRDEWLALRVIFYMAPNTPTNFPPGDSAMMQEHDDGTATVMFVDRDEACSPMKVGKDGLAMLKALRSGRITHPKGGA